MLQEDVYPHTTTYLIKNGYKVRKYIISMVGGMYQVSGIRG